MKRKLKIKKIRFYPNKIIDWSEGVYLGMSLNNNRLKDKDSVLEIIDWIANKTPKCTLLVGDHLHRLNHMYFQNLSEEEATLFSDREADEAIELFEELISNEKRVEFKIQRLKNFYESREFLNKYNRYWELYSNNESFALFINSSINEYINRQAQKITCEERSLINGKEYSLKYLIEELVIFEMLSEEGLTINIYPGKQLPVLKGIVSGELKNISHKLERLQLVEFKFKPSN